MLCLAGNWLVEACKLLALHQKKPSMMLVETAGRHGKQFSQSVGNCGQAP